MGSIIDPSSPTVNVWAKSADLDQTAPDQDLTVCDSV